MFQAIINALNSVSPKVWAVLQFFALIGLVVYGGHLLITGHDHAGESLLVGAFALLKFEVGGNSNSQ